MKRRVFLGAAALALLGLRLRRAFGDASVGPGSATRAFSSALARAARASRPLLVIVIPTDDAQKWERGKAFGEFLNHGSPADLAPLARAEVVCAKLDELPANVGAMLDSVEPLLVRIDPRGGLARTINAELPRYRDRIVVIGDSKPNAEDDDDHVFGRRVATIAKSVRDALSPDASDGVRAPSLAREVRARLVERPPPGSHWATSSGCGTDVEETPEEKAQREAEEKARAERERLAALQGRILALKSKVISVRGCGMGHVPEKSRRFLYFFAKTEN
jgi:hypothetical protein